MNPDLKALREARGWSQAEVASRAGTTQQTVDRVERGVTRFSRAIPAITRVLLDEEEPVLAARIRALLAKAGMSPRAASLAAGMSADGLRQLLSGRTRSVRSESLTKLADVLGTTVNHLLGDDASVSEPGSRGCPGEEFQPVSRPTGPGEGAAPDHIANVGKMVVAVTSGRIRLTIDQEVSISAAQRILAILGEEE